MKFAIPEISWHNRDPVLSVDFQPKTEENGLSRLATGGTDTHVVIWYISTTDSGSVNLEVAADLTRHQKAVNVVRWSPNGQLLASGDDESIIFVWKQKLEKDAALNVEPSEEQYKETWVIHKTLRGHMEDVLDISWSPDSLQLASGSVDNKLLLWDVSKGKYSSILTDHKGFVQGVAWDPRGQLIATASTDRTFRTFDAATKKVVSRSSKAILPLPASHPGHGKTVRLYHDDTLQTYYRRLHWSPDGLLLAVPAGRIEPEQNGQWTPINAVYIYTRYSLKVPACVVPCGEAALAVRWSPVLLRGRDGGPAPALPAPARAVLAVATRRSLLLYDTQQRTPVACISNIHYTRLTDVSWSCDGRRLVAASTDGFCSVVMFAHHELGEPAELNNATEPMEVDPCDQASEQKTTPTKQINKLTPRHKSTTEQVPNKLTPRHKDKNPKMDSFITFKAPEKSPKKQKTEPQIKTPVKMDVLEEMAMPSWSDNSSNEIIKPNRSTEANEASQSEVVLIEDSQDLKLVYEESIDPKSANCSPKDKSLEESKDMKLVYEESNDPKSANTSPKSKCLDESKDSKLDKDSADPKPKSPENSPGSNNTFMKTARVTDVKQPVPGPVLPSPKAPRRVNLITLSSPKNKKKL